MKKKFDYFLRNFDGFSKRPLYSVWVQHYDIITRSITDIMK